MGRQPRRRISAHPRYKRGARLRADEIRKARQQKRIEPEVGAAPPPPPPRSPRPIPPPTDPPPRRWWSRRRIALFGIPAIIAAVLLLPLLVQGWTAYSKIFSGNRSDSNVDVEDLPDWDKQERVNILLIGSDSSPDRREEGEIPRSDTVILVSIDPAAKQVGLLSIPRDLLVTIPGIGEDRINAAYPYGELSNGTGPGLVEATIEHNFGVPIHYFAEVDFQGFQQIVDTLGGVIIDVPAPIKDDAYPGEKSNYTRVYFHSGLQHMDGQTALRYVRTRHDDNDFSRGQRQQQLLLALREHGVDLNLLTQAPDLLSALGDTIRTNLQPIEVLKLAKLGTQIPESNIHSFSLREAVTSSWLPGQPYYLIPDWDHVRVILQQMMPGSPA